MGISGASIAWGTTELKVQGVRAEIGCYPFNPSKKPKPPFFEALRKWSGLNEPGLNPASSAPQPFFEFNYPEPDQGHQ